jgi:hypothetical protein
MWERVQRQMDEGRYHRHTKKMAYSIPGDKEASAPTPGTYPAQLYQDYLRLCKECRVSTTIDGIKTMETFLRSKEEAIRQRYGNVQCSFDVVNENGKPKIKAKLKR